MSAERLTIWQAAFVIARRDFGAILFSRAFIFFLLGPLFPMLVAGLAGGIGVQVQQATGQAEIGIAMESADMDAMVAAHTELSDKLGRALPNLVELKRLEPGEEFDAQAVLVGQGSSISAVVTGTPQAPVLTATGERLQWWNGTVALIAARAMGTVEAQYPQVSTQVVATSGAVQRVDRVRTAQAALTLLFLLIMLLAGMVLSNLVEEKGNKIIEILAAAIPMDAVFLGKLFAMLAVSFVGIFVWGTVGFAIVELGGQEGGVASFTRDLTTPGVGWPLFFLFGVIYFAMGYLLLGSIFLAVGSMASTVREVQTLSMPATMAQLLVFFFATYALADHNGPTELAAIAFPLSSPYAMLSRAAMSDDLLWHVFGIAWQVIWVALFIKGGAALFRKRVMKSGPQGTAKKRRSLFAIIRNRPAK